MAIGWRTAVETDAERLADIRVAAMQPSLERLGRFDPVRARDRFLADFTPAHTTVFTAHGQPIGFCVVRRDDTGLHLDHLYLSPSSQGRGIGAAVLATLCEWADAEALPIRLGALKQSDANRFYERHGFVVEREGEFDLYRLRHPRPMRTAPSAPPDTPAPRLTPARRPPRG